MQIMQKFLFMFCIEVVKNSKAGIRPRQLSVQFNVSDMQICDVTALPARSHGKNVLTTLSANLASIPNKART